MNSRQVYWRQLAFFSAIGVWAALLSGPAEAGYEAPNDPNDNPPAGYYTNATGTGTTLRTNLHTIISTGFHQQSYDNARIALADTDKDPNNPSNLLTVYDRTSVSSVWDSGVTWNREHLWPASRINGGTSGPTADLFELRPANAKTNGGRGNLPYGGGPTASGAPFVVTNQYFFPGDADKGDVSRAMFYMATMYYTGSTTLSPTNLQLINGYTIGSNLPDYKMGDLDSMLHWNYQDGVDNFERNRNQMIYANTIHSQYSQGNRNPYVDHPEYVWAVFGTSANDSQISVGTPASNGSSSFNVNIGGVIVGGTFGTSNVTVNKSGSTPTTFDITTSGAKTVGSGSNLIAGTGQPMDYGAQTKTITAGLTASTLTAGLKSGSITIHNTDLTSSGTGHGLADGDDVINVTGAVLDHANGSFVSGIDSNSLTINIGTFSTGSGTEQSAFNLYNLVNTAGYTAPLVYISSSGTGSTSALTTNIASAFTSPLAAGSGLGITALLNTATAGTFSATYTLNLSDDTSISGATGQSITLTLTGKARGAKTIYWTGASSTWDLGTTSNWTDLSASEVYLNGDTVTFDDSHASNHAVSINSTVTPAAVVVNNNIGASYIISGTGSITGTGSLTKNGTGTFTISSSNSYSGPTVVSAGTLILDNAHAIGNGSLSISGSAAARLNPSLGAAVALSGLSINGGSSSPTGTLDLTNNNMVVTNTSFTSAQSTYQQLAGQVKNAFDNFAWDKPGITSSQVASDVASGVPTSVAVVLNNNLGGAGNTSDELFYGNGTSLPQFAGVSVDQNSVLLKYTYIGDSNLDGKVTSDDLGFFQAGFDDTNQGGTLAQQLGWAVGDYNYDSTVNSDDLGFFQAGFDYYSTNPIPLSGAGEVQPVPEPAGICLSAIGVAIGVGLAKRLRNKKPGGLSTAGLRLRSC